MQAVVVLPAILMMVLLVPARRQALGRFPCRSKPTRPTAGVWILRGFRLPVLPLFHRTLFLASKTKNINYNKLLRPAKRRSNLFLCAAYLFLSFVNLGLFGGL